MREASIVRRPFRVALIRLMNRCLPLRHRYRALLGEIPPGAAFEVPWCGGQLLFPADWLNSFSLFRHVVEGERCMPELRLAEDLLADAPPGGIVDVGAHGGQFVLWARRFRGRKIVAFEPDPMAREILGHVLDINDCPEVRMIGSACGETAGRMRLSTGRVSRIDDGSGDGPGDTSVVALDEALRDEGPIALVKIDVEGFEARVLRGALGLIAEGRAHFLIELHPRNIEAYGDRVGDVVELLMATHDVEIWQFEPGPRVGRLARMLWRSGFLGPRRLPQLPDSGRIPDSSLPPQLYLVARRRIQPQIE